MLYQMNKRSLGATNWSRDLSGYITNFDARAVQPWSGGYIHVASVSYGSVSMLKKRIRNPDAQEKE